MVLGPSPSVHPLTALKLEVPQIDTLYASVHMRVGIPENTSYTDAGLKSNPNWGAGR